MPVEPLIFRKSYQKELYFSAYPWLLVLYNKVVKERSEVRQNESESHSVMSNSLGPHGLYSPWNSLGQNTEVDSLSLLQGIFPIQGQNPGLLHCRQILYQLIHKGSQRILQRVAYPFSSRSFRPRGLMQCRQIIYQLSYQGSSSSKIKTLSNPDKISEDFQKSLASKKFASNTCSTFICNFY